MWRRRDEITSRDLLREDRQVACRREEITSRNLLRVGRQVSGEEIY